MEKSGLDEFKEVLADFRSLGAYIIGGTAVAPVALALANFGPPWPNGVSIITSLAELLVLIFLFHFWYEKKSAQMSRSMIIALVFSTSCFFVYLYFIDTYTFIFPNTGERWAKGFLIRDDIKPLIEELGGELEALKGAEYDQEAIWKPWSITMVRLNLLFLWLLSFIGLSVFIGTFVISQRRRKIRWQSSEYIKVLFLASNPESNIPGSKLKLDDEARSINQKIRSSEYRDVLKLETLWAVRPDDLLQALEEYRPQIVHFSGHGSASGEIILMDNNRQIKPVSAEALKMLFTTLKDNIRVVVLNACYSQIQAQGISEVIDCVIGMSAAIGDNAAITFAAAFYRAIGFGRSIKIAFDSGITAIMLEGIPEASTPQLLSRAGVDPASIFLIGNGEDESFSPSA